jgi:pimeloyl-ACP methyl ester carboxylesterase
MRAFYLGESLVLYHPAEGVGAAVLLCPPLGWDDVCSYRARRDWAVQLAAAGHPVLRVDLPGTGDSGGARRLDAWIDALGTAAAWLRASSGRARVAAVGIGAGGLLAWRAAAAGAAIDDLVLWGTPASGRSLVRELRAFARLEAATLGDQVVDDAIVAGGFRLESETAAALEAVELVAADLPQAADRRVLLLARDGLVPDESLTAGLRAAGADVTVAPGDGYAALMLEPYLSRAPTGVVEEVARWLDGSPGTARAPAPAAPRAKDALELDGVREAPFAAGGSFGILTAPATMQAQPLGAVLLNAGAVRRIGPNRMWVEIARRWAARGVPTVRLDLPGIGDAEGRSDRFATIPHFYVEDVVSEVRTALDALTSERFLLAGLCSGGYWAFQTALADERVTACALVNTGVLVWNDLLLEDRRLQPLRENVVRAVRERRLRELAVLSRVVGRRLLDRLARARGGDAVERAFDRLRELGKRGLLVYEDLDPQRWELERDGSLERVSGHDHTLRPPAMQAQAHAALDRALERELAQPPP